MLLDMETDSSAATGMTQAQPQRLLDHSPSMEVQIRTQGASAAMLQNQLTSACNLKACCTVLAVV